MLAETHQTGQAQQATLLAAEEVTIRQKVSN